LAGAAIFLLTSVLDRSSEDCSRPSLPEIWEKLGRPRDFKIVEQGAHDGVFAADALSALWRSAADCFAATSYCMIEPFPIWRERQQKKSARVRRKDFLGCLG
jgi:Uncharacterized conserved protein